MAWLLGKDIGMRRYNFKVLVDYQLGYGFELFEITETSRQAIALERDLRRSRWKYPSRVDVYKTK